MTTTFEPTIDMSVPKVPLYRLIDVEVRKLIDTRAGLWLMISIGLVIVLGETVLVLAAISFQDVAPWSYMFAVMATPLGLLLAILGVMTVTSEWGQRTSLVTFSLEPRRLRVVLAKLIAGALVAILLLLFTVVFTAGLNALQAVIIDQPAVWDVPRSDVFAFGISQMTAFMLGFAFGMLIPNTPAALVAFFVFQFIVPTMLEGAGFIWDWFEPLVKWIHLDDALAAAFEDAASRDDVLHLLSALGVWVLVPLVLGSFLLVRREIK